MQLDPPENEPIVGEVDDDSMWAGLPAELWEQIVGYIPTNPLWSVLVYSKRHAHEGATLRFNKEAHPQSLWHARHPLASACREALNLRIANMRRWLVNAAKHYVPWYPPRITAADALWILNHTNRFGLAWNDPGASPFRILIGVDYVLLCLLKLLYSNFPRACMRLYTGKERGTTPVRIRRGQANLLSAMHEMDTAKYRVDYKQLFGSLDLLGMVHGTRERFRFHMAFRYTEKKNPNPGAEEPLRFRRVEVFTLGYHFVDGLGPHSISEAGASEARGAMTGAICHDLEQRLLTMLNDFCELMERRAFAQRGMRFRTAAAE